MALVPGARLGSYAIVDQIGVGGMGEVYRATDVNLGRAVAIKVLPEAFAQDTERLARFEREAKTLASLNHPNIAIVHGLERVDGVRALVMELVEGPTLADRIAQAPIPVDEAIGIATQIAEALEAAHEQGIVHRDLKPANIKVRDDGTVKVLDFGLAKIVGPPEPGSLDDGPAQAGHYVAATMSPTITTPAMTQLGMILGTAAYMAPEQARGKAVDKRSDIWAFGCVLFEMLTGRKAFDGEDVTDTIAAVVRAEPRWDLLPSNLPASIRLLLQRCLEKDRKKRIGDISGALFVMREQALLASAAVSDVTPRRWPSRWPHAAWALVAVAASTVAAFTVWTMMRREPSRVTRLELLTSGPSQLARHLNSPHVVIARDGSRVFYVGGAPGGPGSIFTRSLDRIESTQLTEAGSYPFASPDGQWIGYFVPGMMRKVAVTGGPSTEITRTDGALRGATWGPDDSIIFATNIGNAGLFRVDSAGGKPVVLTTPDQSKGESGHVWPRFLPGGGAVLLTIWSSARDNASAQVAVLDLNSAGATPKVLIRGGSDARYLPTGHLVYLAGDSLRAIPFDLDRLEVGRAASVPVLPSVGTATVGTSGDFDVADNGTLVFVPPNEGLSDERTLVWTDRQGKEEAIPAPPRVYLYPRISPDGTRLAVDVREQEGDIWIWDLLRRSATRVTKDRNADRAPVWTKDGQYIIYSAMSEGSPNVFRQRADGTGTPERLAKATLTQFPLSLSPDGSLVLFSQGVAGAAVADLMAIRVDGDAARPVLPLVNTSSGETNGAISPDGRWLAYQSNESGPWEIYITPFPVSENGARSTVSTGGGTQPRWSPDGRELYYISSRNEMMAMRVQAGASWSAGRPERIFDASSYFVGGNSNPFFSYDVAKDGRFLMIKPVASPASNTPTPASVIVVQNWFEELKRLVPAN